MAAENSYSSDKDVSIALTSLSASSRAAITRLMNHQPEQSDLYAAPIDILYTEAESLSRVGLAIL